MSEFPRVRRKGLKLHFRRPEGKISRRELLKLASPLGKVTLDGSRCTGCGLCADDCPTRGLTVSANGENDVYQLLFKHSLCIACGQCIELCPEQCLCLERTLELDSLSNPPVVLFEDSIARCGECGNPIGSKAMIEKLQAKLPAGRDSLTAHFELCPECKVKQFRLVRTAPEPADKPD